MFHVFVIVFLLLFSYYLFLREEVMFSPVFVCHRDSSNFWKFENESLSKGWPETKDKSIKFWLNFVENWLKILYVSSVCKVLRVE